MENPQGESVTDKVKVIGLNMEMKEHVPKVTHSEHAINAIYTLFSRPIFKSADFIAESGIPKSSAHRAPEGIDPREYPFGKSGGERKQPDDLPLLPVDRDHRDPQLVIFPESTEPWCIRIV